MDIIDIRQSDSWSAYLEMYNWKSIRLSNTAVVRIAPLLGLNVAKLQRPVPLTEYDLNEVMSVCKEYKVLFIKFFPGLFQDINLLRKFEYREIKSVDIPPRTMFIDLTKKQEILWNKISSKGRYSINKSRRSGDIIELIQNPGAKEISNYYKLVSARGKKKKYFVQSIKDQQRKVEIFGQKSFICNVYNKYGEILGTKMFLGFGKVIFGMHAATSELGQKSCGGYKLLWESFSFFQELGYTLMDLDGLADDRVKKLTSAWQGYTRFKLHFNGDIVDYSLPYIKYFNVLAR